MTTIEAIETLGDLRMQLSQRYLAVQLESERIEQEWDCLGRVGGQREDHAASLLSRMRNSLLSLGSFCDRVQKQLDEFAANPFGDRATPIPGAAAE